MKNISASVPKLTMCERKIIFAYLELICENSIDKIRVSQLCKIAGVNRSTFYRSFFDIYDLEEKLEKYFIDSMVYFWASNDFGYFNAGSYILSVSKLEAATGFDRELFDRTLNSMKFDKRLAGEMFTKLFEAIMDSVDEDIRNDEKLKNVLKFILNGSIFYYLYDPSAFDYDVIDEFEKITSCIFSNFIAEAKNKSEFSVPITTGKKTDIYAKNKERLSVMKTKKSLRAAFFELSTKKDSGKITVSALCEKAEVSHATFYNHYSSIEDFISKIKEDVIDTSVNIGYNIYSSMDAGTLDITDLASFIAKCQANFAKFPTMNSASVLELPREFSKRFCKYMDESYDCIFDSHLAFSIICNCAFCSLIMPCDGNSLSLEAVMGIAYQAVLFLFKRKE